MGRHAHLQTITEPCHDVLYLDYTLEPNSPWILRKVVICIFKEKAILLA